MNSRLTAITIAILLLAACTEGDITGPAEDISPEVRTEKLAYVAHYEGGSGSYRTYGFDVVTTFENSTNRTIYVSRCSDYATNPMYSVVLDGVSPDGDGESAYNPAWACMDSSPLAVRSGESRIDTLHIFGPISWDGRTDEVLGVMEGDHRIRYGASSCPEQTAACALPDSLLTSNVFEVSVAWID